MSVQTTADKQLDAAKKAIKIAIEHLAEIVINQCDGHDEWNDGYTTSINLSLSNLLTIRARLG